MITAPYNFVPLNDKIFYPPWASEDALKNIQDVPFEDGESGEIEIQIEAKSPIFIKNHANTNERSESKIQDKSQKALEFCNFNGEYYIPATSIKGMLRNTLEIMSFSAIKFINDKKYSFRDLNNDEYVKRVMKDIHCGWLFKDKYGEYNIKECKGIYRIKYDAIESKFKLQDYKARFLKGNFNEKEDVLKSACEKYKLIGLDRLDKVYTFSTAGSSNGRMLLKFDNFGKLKGKIVLTGHPSGRQERVEEDNKVKKPSGKIFDFVFVEKQDAQTFSVSDEVLENFKFAYFDGKNKQPKESLDWKFWKERLKDGEAIPVFFHKEDKKVTSFGLSYLYKFPYKNSVKTALNFKQKISEKLDLSELIFGYSKKINGKQTSMKGRVFISQAKTKKKEKPRVLNERTILLGSPKASYYPNYIVQDGDNYKTFDNANAEISGWKRYPIHKKEIFMNMSKSSQTTSIKPLDAGAKFRFKIVLHNMLPIEIGALLSAITFHGNDACYHSIGMAKPLGYGKIKLNVLELKGFSKDIKEYLRDFESAINSEIFSGKIKWHESEQIKNLFSMASEQNNAENLKYMALEDFAKVKTKGDSLKRYIKLANINTIQATPLSDEQSISAYQNFIDDLKAKERELKEKIKREREEKELQEATVGMSESDKRIYKLKKDPAYKDMPESTALFKAVTQTDLFDDIKYEALCELKKLFKDSGKWKEQTKQKKPEKDREYQDTLKIIALLEEFKK